MSSNNDTRGSGGKKFKGKFRLRQLDVSQCRQHPHLLSVAIYHPNGTRVFIDLSPHECKRLATLLKKFYFKHLNQDHEEGATSEETEETEVEK